MSMLSGYSMVYQAGGVLSLHVRVFATYCQSLLALLRAGLDLLPGLAVLCAELAGDLLGGLQINVIPHSPHDLKTHLVSGTRSAVVVLGSRSLGALA